MSHEIRSFHCGKNLTFDLLMYDTGSFGRCLLIFWGNRLLDFELKRDSEYF
jgi:hypothetical protein